MIRTIRSIALLCLTVLVAAAIGVPSAMAANVTPWATVSFNSSTDPNSAVLIVAGTLPDDVKLPATVELAAPTGTTLQWAGEILGGDAAADPEVETTKTVRDGQDIYTFQITKSRTAQLEVTTAAPVTINGSTYMVNFSVPAWTDMPSAGVAVQIPAAAQLSEQPTGTAGLAPGPTGFQYYQQDFTSVKKGDIVGVSFSYTLGTGAAAGATPTSGSSLLIPMLLVGIAIAVGVALVVGVRRKLSANSDDSDDRPARPTGSQRAKAAVEPAAESAFADDDGDAVENTEVADEMAAPAAPRNNLALVGTLVIVGVLVAAGVVAATQGGKARTTGGVISKTFATGEACTNSTVGLAFPEGTDTAAAAEQLFTALATVPSVTVATVQLEAPSISIGYCDSETNEAAIVQALTPTGYVVAGSATTPSSDSSASTPASATTN